MKIKMLHKSFGCAVLLVLLGQSYAFAQQIIRGTVTSKDKEPLIGVTVQVKSMAEGTITDFDGKYEIAASPSDSLVFSYVGYATQTVYVGNRTQVDVTLDDSQTLLEEVVVIGYGSIKKSDLTGSVASLAGRQIAQMPIANAAQAITGRLPGVNVLTTDGSPDAEVVIRVRGGGSITQDNSPLYVVDGFIVNSIRDIPPTDIESISVLKDASATAIYGAQAANGVILITTKRPQAGKISVTYNGFAQFKTLPQERKYQVLSPYEYVLANYEIARLRSTADLTNFEKFFGKYDDLELYQFRKGTDWQDELFGDPQLSQYHNFSVSGGNATTKLSLSLTNNNDEGLLTGNGFNRNVINFKLEQQLSSKLTLDATARINRTIVDGAGTSGSAQVNVKDAVQTRPINGLADELIIDLNAIDPDDDYQAFLRALVNPNELVKQDWRNRTTNDYIFNAALKWAVFSNLNLQTTFTTSKQFDNILRFYGPLTNESFNNGGNLPLGEKTNRELFSYRWLNTVDYKVKNLGAHKLDFLLGHEIYSDGGNTAFIRAEDFRVTITPEELFANMAFGRTDRLSTAELTNSNRLSFFGRTNYNFRDKYLLTATFRSDASSKFAKENRVGIFPAVALGWKLSEEGFLKDVDFINELKLRASYGATGNDRIDATATQFLFQAATFRGPGFGNVENVFYSPTGSTLYNPNIKWETTINRNLGLDFTLFKGKLGGSFDVYKNTTRDLLLQSAIPSNTGFRFQWNNIGTTSNRGAELSLNYFFIEKRDFSLSANFNIGINRNRIEALDGSTERFFQSNWASTDLRDVDDFYLEVGGTLGNIYGYITEGYYSTDDFAGYDPVTQRYALKEGIPNSGPVVGNNNIRPGFLRLKDLNGDGVINSQDRTIIGNTLPKHQGGFSLEARFKGLDFSAFFNWSYGNDVYNTNKIQFNQLRRINYGNLTTDMSLANRFSYIDIDGTYTGIPGEVVTDLGQLAQMNAGKNIWSHASFGIAQATIHSWAVEDGSFLRLNNLNLGYTLPASLVSKMRISNLRLYATGNNLFVLTKYSGYDPEVSTSRSSSFSALTPGVDYSAFPRSRSYTFGVNVTF